MRATSAITQQTEHARDYAYSLFSEALQEFRSSLQAVPRNPDTLVNTADIFHHLKYPNLAQLFYNAVIEVRVYKIPIFLGGTQQCHCLL